MSETRDYSHFVQADGSGSRMDFVVEGVSCAGCIAKIERRLRALPGVEEARVNFTTRRLSVRWRDGATGPAEIAETVEKAGYRAHPFVESGPGEEARTAHWLLTCLAVAGFAAMNVMLLSVSVWSGNVSDITPETRDMFHWLSALIALPAAAFAGQPFFRSAWNALKRGGVNMDVPISLGVILALGMSVVETANHATHAYFDSAVMLLFFLLCGRYLDHEARRRVHLAAGNLAALQAATAHRLDGRGDLAVVAADALRAGDRVMVMPGERVPADGEVISGVSEIDDSLITGETATRRVTAGAGIHAGCVNGSGALTVRVLKAGESTLLAEIRQLLDRAVAAKSRYVRLADRVARLYAPVVHLTAAATAIGWMLVGASVHDAVIVAIAVLIITCPCALALAVPAVQVVAAGRMFRAGIFLNAGDCIERLARVDTVVFDKTGTLTLPEMRVANAGAVDPAVLEQAARLALSSRHPLAAALASEARNRRPWDGAVETPGEGVRAIVDGVEARLGSLRFCGVAECAGQFQDGSLIAFRRGDVEAVFAVRQSLRPDAVRIVNDLRWQGFDVRILSGDRAQVVGVVAAQLGVSDWRAEVKPGDKAATIAALAAEGRRVLMVGDGLNDAAALAAAHVSIAPVAAADLAKAQADAVFLGDRLAPVTEAIAIARRARRLMAQNLGIAVVYNFLAVPVAIAGLVTPLIAAAAMSGSSIVVTLNALRAGRRVGAAPRPAKATADSPTAFRTAEAP